jgi:phosphomannomutase
LPLAPAGADLHNLHGDRGENSSLKAVNLRYMKTDLVTINPEIVRSVFKSYDVRGKYGSEITEALANQIGRAFVQVVHAKKVAVGRDMRNHSPRLEEALIAGITAAGADAIRVGQAANGQCSTPMSYFAAATLDVDGALMVTASHNPPEDNGLKFCKRGGEPMGEGTGLEKVRELVLAGASSVNSGRTGTVTAHDVLPAWCQHLRQYLPQVRPMKVVLDFGNGVMGPINRA